MADSSNPIRAWRQAQNVSQKELAADIGTSTGNLSRIENGEQPVSDELLPKVVERTGIPAGQLRPDLAKLFEGAGQPLGEVVG